MVRPTRTSQPYRKTRPRMPGPALTAMRRGRTLYGHNPQDGRRELLKRALRRRARQRGLY